MCNIKQYIPDFYSKEPAYIYILRDTYKYIFLNRKEIHCFLQFPPSLNLK